VNVKPEDTEERDRGRHGRDRPAVARWVRNLAIAVVAPFVLFVIAGVVFSVAEGKAADSLEGIAFWLGLLVLPILGAVWVATRGLRRTDRWLQARHRSRPPLSERFARVSWDETFGGSAGGPPLFERVLGHLWSRAAIVREQGVELRVFEFVHGDMLGEGGRLIAQEGGNLRILSCAAARVEADLPVLVIRSRFSRPMTLPDGLVERTTELESFNRKFKLLTADAYAATAVVDARMIEIVAELDERFSVEIGGQWVVIYAARLDETGLERLIDQTASLARVFPNVVRSLYPTRRLSGDAEEEPS
jgi:hypothetical protein